MGTKGPVAGIAVARIHPPPDIRRRAVRQGEWATRPASWVLDEVEDAFPPMPAGPMVHAMGRCATGTVGGQGRGQVRTSIDPRGFPLEPFARGSGLGQRTKEAAWPLRHASNSCAPLRASMICYPRSRSTSNTSVAQARAVFARASGINSPEKGPHGLEAWRSGV